MQHSMEGGGRGDSRADSPDLSIVIPVYNEEQGLPALFDRLGTFIQTLGGTSVEVLFVDDHSADRSPAMLATACRKNPTWRFLRLSSNRGSHIAISAGLEHCRGRCAVFLAADLQDPPELIPNMLARWREGYQVIWAVRDEREGVSWFEKTMARSFYTLFNRLAQVSLPPSGSDFALLDRAVLDAVRRSAGATPFLMGEIAQVGFRQTSIGYVKEERKFGETKWNLRKRLKLFADAFVSFSYFPLRAMSTIGMIASFIGFLYAAFVAGLRLTVGTPIDGWASLMVVVLVLGGFQMIMLGVLGEYLWRTLEQARQRPRYFIEESVGIGAVDESGQAENNPRPTPASDPRETKLKAS